MISPSKKFGSAIGIMAMIAVMLLGLAWWNYTIDDSFITFRYAKNLALGNGAVFNIGEQVEGCSCPLWAAFLSLGIAIGLDPVVLSKIVGLVCAGVLVFLMNLALRRCSCDPVIGGIACCWMASVWYFHVYACSGMETIPYMLAVSVTAFSPALFRHDRIRTICFPTAIIAVALMRPEGFPVALAVSVWWIVWQRKRYVFWGLALAWVVLIGIQIWRVAYFGSFFPNTYIDKPSPIAVAYDQGFFQAFLEAGAQIVGALNPFIASVGGLLVVGFALVSVIDKSRRFVVGNALLVFVVGALFVVYAPKDWMPGYRFGLPYVSSLIFAGALGVDYLRSKLPKDAWKPLKFVGIIVICGWVILNGIAIAKLRINYYRGHMNTGLNGALYAEIGRWLHDNSNLSDRVLAYEIGAVGYYSGLYIIDHEGIVNPYVASIVREAGNYPNIRYGADRNRMNMISDYCVDQHPDWFLVRSRTGDALEIGQPIDPIVAQETVQQAILEKLGDSMVLAKIFPLHTSETGDDDFYLLLHRRM